MIIPGCWQDDISIISKNSRIFFLVNLKTGYFISFNSLILSYTTEKLFLEIRLNILFTTIYYQRFLKIFWEDKLSLKKINALFSCQYLDVNELYPRIPFVLLENNVLDVRYPLSVSVMSALISDISLRWARIKEQWWNFLYIRIDRWVFLYEILGIICSFTRASYKVM